MRFLETLEKTDTETIVPPDAMLEEIENREKELAGKMVIIIIVLRHKMSLSLMLERIHQVELNFLYTKVYLGLVT